MIEPRYYQTAANAAAWEFLGEREGNPLIVLPTGCHSAGHPILMADGTIIPVERVLPGQCLMGPDGKPRTVINLCRGEDDLFEIMPVGGESKSESFVVNGNHVLHLEATREGKPFASSLKGGERINITVNEYLKKAKSWKHLWKLRQSDAIEFPDFNQVGNLFQESLDIPPYIVGMMLGDGHMKHGLSLATADEECANELHKFASSHSWTIHKSSKAENNKASSYRIKSGTRGRTCTAKKLFSKYGLMGKTGSEKTVPKEFLLADTQSRLELLAGLIDSDGHHDGRGGITFSNKSKILCDDVAFIARSLGMRARISESWKKSQSSEKRKYFVVSISGDTIRIPSRLQRKSATERRQKKNVLRIGFTVKPVGRGQFFGFTLSGDHLYLDGNFLIHHNSGKSLVIAMLIKQAREFGARVVVLAHRKELIVQNSMELQELMPEITVGVYSAGLNSRNTSQAVVIAGIQSVFRKAEDIGERHLVIVDEAHLISDKEESMYGQFLGDIARNNPSSRVVGLTATPFRTGTGPLCGKDKLFQKICYEAQTADLIAQGFLCPITNKPTASEVDTSALAIRGGEVVESDAQKLFDTSDNVESACRETVEKCVDRKSILVFSSGVVHAEHIAETLHRITGERVGIVTGDSMPLERSILIDDFKNQRLRWLVNCDVLTTGFNAKCVDAIAVMRATMSPGLFAQIIGRGLRLHENKENCYILDFGENIKRHGSIDDPNYGRASAIRQGSGKATVAAANNGRGKPCPSCDQDVAANAKECPDCGFVFPVTHQGTSDDESQLTGKPEPEDWIVTHCSYKRHNKKGDPDAPPTLRVDYDCVKVADALAKTLISEWVCIQHSGYARTKAGLWWQARSECMEPDTVDDAVNLLKLGVGRVPCKIRTVKDGKYTRIIGAEFDCERPTELPEQVEVKVFDGFDEVPF